MLYKLGAIELLSIDENFHRTVFLTQEHCKLITLKLISTFFRRTLKKVLKYYKCFTIRILFVFFEVFRQLFLEH